MSPLLSLVRHFKREEFGSFMSCWLRVGRGSSKRLWPPGPWLEMSL